MVMLAKGRRKQGLRSRLEEKEKERIEERIDSQPHLMYLGFRLHSETSNS